MKIPHKCPHCLIEPGKNGVADCGPCKGTGVVWGDDGISPAFVPYPVYPPMLPWYEPSPWHQPWYPSYVVTCSYAANTQTLNASTNVIMKPANEPPPIESEPL